MYLRINEHMYCHTYIVNSEVINKRIFYKNGKQELLLLL